MADDWEQVRAPQALKSSTQKVKILHSGSAIVGDSAITQQCMVMQTS